MDFRAFTQTHVYEKQSAPKEKDKSSIQCLECYDRNVYIGTKDATVQHLMLPSSTNGDQSPGQSKTREGRTRKLGSNNPITQLRVVPLFNHLLVLWDRSVTALNMFSLEPVPGLKKIQHVSLFEVSDSLLAAQVACVEMVTSSSRRKVIRIHVVGVDRWDVVKEVPLLHDPVALAVDGASVCVATSDRYLLCDIRTGSSEELFPHSHSRQRVFVISVGRGEFLLNGPESLGMFVMKTGICQRPPLQWPQEVLAARVCFPYILTLQPQVLSVYSMVDQQRKQTVSLSGAKGLLSTSDGVLVFTERDIFSLRLVPMEEQIQALVRHERVEEALLLLDGVQGRRPLDSYKELQNAITCLAGFVHFCQEGFSEAKDLFITGELDPREIIRLYPDMQSCLSEDFQSQLDQVNKGRDLQVLCQEDRNTFHHYLAFLGDFLRAVKGTEQGLKCSTEVDCALLRLYVELGDTENLQQLVAFPNECRLDHCVPVLEQHNRLFALGSLYQCHGNLLDAIKTWVKIADGFHKDPSCSDVYGHIVWTLSQLQDEDAVWKFADWTLQKNQEIGVQIFIKRPPDDRFETQDVLALLEKYPQALLLYLEFLIYDLNSEEERHHTCLALAYVTQMLRNEEEADLRKTRGKLQQLLWESKFYDVSTVYERVKSANLHMEKAILLGRAGEHSQALQVLVHQEVDFQAAEAYCCRAAQGRDSQFRQTLLLTLLQIYLSSEELTSAAVDLLNNNPRVFAAEKIIQLLPDSWSIQLVSQFLVGSLRETFHQRRMSRLQKALGQVELMRHKVIWMQASKTTFRLDRGKKCKVCQRDLAEPQFACNLHGDLMHTSCTGFSSP
ncbi:LOW QUALITY PROTEIN: transforming growth factor-beta receptor-associated protein 1 [Cottoperca gobio]|uniref:LOW QUALITY PROTEIN: transforming growth factor-beta receptor-associated protein 1 n=1 Tax=Cottoperca gobio TaxID=56716 RepID=A0A6J2S261_COTGO|nr:LOW QUALITY PROTEIN: transforming growth factor-beta receptor-associated protein 1-like [Cottoperca gobio]